MIALCSYILLEINNVYPEKFRIKSVVASILKIDGVDTLSGCYLVSDMIYDINENDSFLLAVRYELDYVSEKHEFLFNVPKSPWGAFGHVDSIISYRLFFEGGGSFNEALSNAASYRYFFKEGDLSPIGQGHHTQGKCYVAQTFDSLNDFVSYYNAHSEKYNLVSDLKDYAFFTIGSSIVKELFIKNHGRIELKFRDDVVLKNEILLLKK